MLDRDDVVGLLTTRNKDRPRGCKEQLVKKAELFLEVWQLSEPDARDPFYRGRRGVCPRLIQSLLPAREVPSSYSQFGCFLVIHGYDSLTKMTLFFRI